MNRYKVQRREQGFRKFRVTGYSGIFKDRRVVGLFWTEQGANNWIARQTWVEVPANQITVKITSDTVPAEEIAEALLNLKRRRGGRLGLS